MADLQRLWLLGLWVLWAALLFLGFVFGKEAHDHSRRMPVWTRMGSSMALVIAAWSFYFIIRVQPQSIPALLFAVGMTLGFVGDLFMARLLIKSDAHVIGGISAFGLGHIAYIAGILQLIQISLLTLLWMIVGITWMIGLVWWFIVVYHGANRDVTHYAALPYTLLLSTTAGLAIAAAAVDQSEGISAFTIVGIGGVLFLLSDLILAARLFRQVHFRLIDDVVWLTYGPAQMLIVYSLLWFIPSIPFIYGFL
jgi:hypothetical protein